ncbi:hypothetical protein AgCh_022968 [Apium graveolens]
MIRLTKESKCFTLEILFMQPGMLYCPPQLETIMNYIMKENGEFVRHGTKEVLTMALQAREHSERVQGVGGFFTPTIFFNFPKEEKTKITKAKLLDQLERNQREIDELKALVNASNGDSPMVAFGIICDDQERMNISVHMATLNPGHVRVSIDRHIQPEALVPVSIPQKIEVVHQALGSHVAWPRELCPTVMELNQRSMEKHVLDAPSLVGERGHLFIKILGTSNI